MYSVLYSQLQGAHAPNKSQPQTFLATNSQYDLKETTVALSMNHPYNMEHMLGVSGEKAVSNENAAIGEYVVRVPSLGHGCGQKRCT